MSMLRNALEEHNRSIMESAGYSIDIPETLAFAPRPDRPYTGRTADIPVSFQGKDLETGLAVIAFEPNQATSIPTDTPPECSDLFRRNPGQETFLLPLGVKQANHIRPVRHLGSYLLNEINNEVTTVSTLGLNIDARNSDAFVVAATRRSSQVIKPSVWHICTYDGGNDSSPGNQTVIRTPNHKQHIMFQVAGFLT